MTALTDIQSRSGVAEGAALVTLADADLPGGVAEGLLVGTAGAANLMFADGSIVTGFPLQQGYNPVRVLQVRTGTAASNIWALK